MYNELVDCLNGQSITLTHGTKDKLGIIDGNVTDTYVANNLEDVADFLQDTAASAFHNDSSLDEFLHSPSYTTAQMDALINHSDVVISKVHSQLTSFEKELNVTWSNLDFTIKYPIKNY